MLHLLAEYARKHDLVVEPGFKPKDVRWCIVCDADGQYLDVVELGDTSQKRNRGMTFHRCPEYSFSELKAGGVTKCHFLVETAEVVVLHSKKPDDPKVVAKHNYFLKMLHDAGSVIPELTRLSNHLSQPVTLREICIRMEALKVKPTDKVTFRTGDSFPVESDAWHDWWRKLRKTVSDDQSEQKHRSKRNKSPCQMRCFLTGELAYPAPTHPKIEGLSSVGGLATGDVLIGFKQDSFRSYGLVQSTNAAVSEVSASIYRAALNHIIKERGQRLAGAMVVHWFRENVPDEDDPLPWLNTGGETEELNAQRRARELLESIRAGNRSDLQGNHYYAITLSGASGRVMVRDWMEGQFDELVENIRQWFDDLEVVDRRGQGMARPPKFFAVLGATVRDLDELSAPFVSKLWRVAVRCEPIPKSALSKALMRTRIDIIEDSPPNHARMGLLKAYHVRKDRNNGKEPIMKPYLNEEHPHPAYHCGRLMAVLAGLQRSALGDVGAGVVQRYYAAASTTPALVLGRVTNTSHHHLSKLDSPGLAHWYEGKIASIWGRIKDNIPTTLSLEEQSLFALGYYQQMADLRTKKSDKDNHEKEKDNE